jgi:CRISPR-associated protein Cmr2
MASSYLIQLHIGPIQGFITTARRTRDLWFGSYLLSEISKAAARSLVSQVGVTLTFPAAGAADVVADSDLSVVNVVLAEAQGHDEAAALAVAKAAKAAAEAHWRELCEKAWQQLGGNGGHRLRANVWNAQRDDVLEVFYAVAPLHPERYAASVDAARGAMATRKGLRNARALADEPAGLPKSSLDGQRSTVLQEAASSNQPAWVKWRRKVGLGQGEQLDLAGLVKRVMGREERFVPVGRIALAPWLDEVLAAAPTDLVHAMVPVFEDLVEMGDASRISTARYRWAGTFPFDGQLFFRGRREVWRQEMLSERTALEPQVQRDLAQRIARFEEALAALKAAAKVDTEPSPYYVMLLADGDRMGELLDAAVSSEEHREVSACLAAFAAAVPGHVDSEAVGGACIYAGGDDVLALMRLDRALDGATQLASMFAEQMAPAVGHINARRRRDGLQPVQAPTLSVGLAVCHMLEPLGDARELAKAAEFLAKDGTAGTPKDQQRNALGIVVKPRGGGELRLRLRWDDDAALARLKQQVAWFERGDLPAGLPYELRDALAEARATFKEGHDLFRTLWLGSLQRTLSRKRRPLDDQPLSGAVLEALTQQLTQDPQGAGDSLMLARWLTGQGREGR